MYDVVFMLIPDFFPFCVRSHDLGNGRLTPSPVVAIAEILLFLRKRVGLELFTLTG